MKKTWSVVPPAFWLTVSAVLIRPQPDDKGDERQSCQGQEHRANRGNDDPEAQEDEYQRDQDRHQSEEGAHGYFFGPPNSPMLAAGTMAENWDGMSSQPLMFWLTRTNTLEPARGEPYLAL